MIRRCRRAALWVAVVLSLTTAAAQTANEWLVRAQEATKEGKHTEAVGFLTRAIETDPSLAQAYLERAWSHQRLRENKEAVADLDRYLTMRPADVNGWVSRAQIKVTLGDADGGLSDANRAVFLDASKASAYFQRGRARARKADDEGAIADYSTALLLDPKMAGAHNTRAVVRQHANDLKGAEEDYRKALEIDPNHELAKNNLNALLVRTGQAAPPPLPDDPAALLPPPPPLPPLPPLPPPSAGGTAGAEVVRIGEGMVEPRLVRRVEPVLSEVARQARLTGAVDLDVEVGPDGRVRKVTVLTPLPLLGVRTATDQRPAHGRCAEGEDPLQVTTRSGCRPCARWPAPGVRSRR